MTPFERRAAGAMGLASRAMMRDASAVKRSNGEAHDMQGDLHHRRRIGHRPRDRAAVRARGWRVGLADVNAARAGRDRGAAARRDRRRPITMDVRDRDAWVDSARRLHRPAAGGSTCCSTTPGSPTGGPLAETRFDEIDRVIAINLIGVAQRRADRPCLSEARRRDRACSTPPRPRRSTARRGSRPIRRPSSGCAR